MKKIILGYTTYQESAFNLPKKYEFYFEKDEDDYTDKEWDLIEEFQQWLIKMTNTTDDNIDIIDVM